MKTVKTTLIILFMISITVICSCKKKEGQPRTDLIKLEIAADKGVYDINDEIRLSFTMTNISEGPVHIAPKTLSELAWFIRVSLKSGEKISYTGGTLLKDAYAPDDKGRGYMVIKPDEPVTGTLLLKVNPVERITSVPYDADAVSIDIKLTKDDYSEKDIETFYPLATGLFVSNEVPIRINKRRYTKRLNDFLDIDYVTDFFKSEEKNSDILILKGLTYDPDDRLTKADLANEKKYVKTFRQPGGKYDLFEFYANGKLARYLRLHYDQDKQITGFIIYNQNGLINLRYEYIKEDDGSYRWDKYFVDFLTDTDIYLGYIKISTDGEKVWISEMLMQMNKEKYKKYTYSDAGKVTSREETPPPPGTQMRKRKY